MTKNNKKYFYLIHRIYGAGFGSEINQILYAVYYFRKHNYSFKIISLLWNASHKKGWFDYFNSLRSEHFSTSWRFVLIKYLFKITKYKSLAMDYKKVKQRIIVDILVSRLAKNHCITRENNGFIKMREFCYKERKKDYKKFCLNMHLILNDIWKIKPKIQEYIKRQIPQEKYICIHIRRGDKLIREDRKYEIDEYTDALLKLDLGIKTVFLMSDDYDTYIDLKQRLPEFKILTLMKDSRKGYSQVNFNRLPRQRIKEHMLVLFTEIEIARKSEVFIGTYKSNIFRLIEYFKLDNCYDISHQVRVTSEL